MSILNVSILAVALGRAPDGSQRDAVNRKIGACDLARNRPHAQTAGAKKLPPGFNPGVIGGEDGLAGDSQMKYSKFERG
jgi:hypothetical protein